MLLIKIIGIGIVTSIAVVLIKQLKPEIAIVVGLAGSILILLNIATLLGTVIDTFTDLTEKTGIDSSLFMLLLKIVGVGYLTEFSANLCADTGSTSIADKILLAGKVIIMIIALPIITTLLDIIYGLMNL